VDGNQSGSIQLVLSPSKLSCGTRLRVVHAPFWPGRERKREQKFRKSEYESMRIYHKELELN